ncbi:histidine phosphatase family protein [Candidatus Shapirobacteria bacterium]|nr:histidine phosphatase family protein [Candidatus Shapirobacteria bacterium]
MSTIYLFRHGQTEFNRDKRFTGWQESALTPDGVKQAEYLGTLLKDKKIDVAYTSHLTRAIDTLDAVLKYHPSCQSPIIDDRIIERSYGILETHFHQEAIDKYGLDQFNQWHRGWEDKVEKGESLADVQVRVADFINFLTTTYQSKGTGIAISAHGNSIRVFRKIMENTSVEECVSWKIPYDQFYEYQL